MNAPRMMSGVINVVSRTTVTMTATSGSLKMPVLAPMAVTISPTSPREIMPQPTRKLGTGPIPMPSAAIPHPMSLLTTATSEDRGEQKPVATQCAEIAR